MTFNFVHSIYLLHLAHNLLRQLILIKNFIFDSQIEAADKQLRATRQFLEDQAAEREQERDEFSKEIETLRATIKEKDKDKTSQETYQKEVKQFSYV